MYPIEPSKFETNPFNKEWIDKDFFHSPDGSKEFPEHHCKLTYVKSSPFINTRRNAIDVGARDGEYTRYLHNDFNHVYCFEYRRRKLFHMNVDLNKVTHFKCALGEEHKVIDVSGGGSITSSSIPKEKWRKEKIYTLDSFELPDIDYIKIDVDGFELRVLMGATKTIQQYKPLVVLEAERGERSAIDYLESNFNYKIVAWDNAQRNVVMKHKEK